MTLLTNNTREFERVQGFEQDFSNHIDYIHYNLVKHGYVKRPVDWAHSSIHRYIRQGILPAIWGGDVIVIHDSIGHE